MSIKNKILMPFLLLLLIQTGAFSQVYLGGRLGVNMSNLSNNNFMGEYKSKANFTPKISVSAAGLAYFELGPYFSIQPEIMYIRKGGKTFVDYNKEGILNSNTRGEWNISLHYLETPLMFKLSLNTEGFDPFIEFGPYVSWMFSASYESFVEYNYKNVNNEKYDIDYKKDIDGTTFNTKDFGFKVGIGGAIKLAKGVGFFSFRYSKGLNDVFKYKSNANIEETYNGSFVLTIGMTFEMRNNSSKKTYYY